MEELVKVLNRVAVALEKANERSRVANELTVRFIELREKEADRGERIENEWRVENERLSKELKGHQKLDGVSGNVISSYMEAFKAIGQAIARVDVVNDLARAEADKIQKRFK